METLFIIGLFVTGCLAQSPFAPSGVQFQTGVGTSFQPGVSQPGIGTQFQPGVGQPGIGTQFQPGVGQPGIGTQFQPGVVGQTGVGTQFQPGTVGQPGFVPQTGLGRTPFQPGGFPQLGVGTQFQPGVSSPTGVQFQPGINTATGTQFQPGVGTQFQPGVGTQFQPGVGTPVQTGVSTPFQQGLNPAIQAQILTQGGRTTAGFGTMGPFAPGGIPGSTGFVGPQFLGPQPGFTDMQVPMSPIAALMMSLARNPNNYRYATCMFNDTMSTRVVGRIDFRQFLIGEGRQQVNVRIQLAGLPASSMDVFRGIHVHEFGDIGDQCARVGPHFNPSQTPHGSRRNFAFLRHVGDLGNILQSQQGMSSTQFSDHVISLEGVNNIVGRSIVITQERDDEGFGGNTDSQINGNARTPLACCTVGRTRSRNWYNPLSAMDIQNMASTGILPDETFLQFSGTMNTMNLANTVNGGFVNQVNPVVGTNTGTGFGQVSFSPTNTNGQTFTFATQGKKK